MALHLVIGNKNYSSWSFRPWLAMKMAGIAFEETVISLEAEDFKARVTAVSGAGKVPVLMDGEIRVWESLAILEYLAEKFPAAALWPIGHLSHRYRHYEFDPASVEKVFGKTEAMGHLIALGEEFANTKDWSLGGIEAALKGLASKIGCKTGDLVHPARVAVSGRSIGPSLYHMLEVMGQHRVLSRFDRMRSQLGTQ